MTTSTSPRSASQAFSSAPSGVTVINEHDETLLGEAGAGGALHRPEGRRDVRNRRRSRRGADGSPRQRAADREAKGDRDRGRHDDPGRRSNPGARHTSSLRRKPPRHSPRTARATTKRRWRRCSSSSGSSRTIPSRTSTPGASRHVSATRTRRRGTSKRSIEINDRIKELIATDEDLDSIREDPRFAELAEEQRIEKAPRRRGFLIAPIARASSGRADDVRVDSSGCQGGARGVADRDSPAAELWLCSLDLAPGAGRRSVDEKDVVRRVVCHSRRPRLPDLAGVAPARRSRGRSRPAAAHASG